VIRDEVIEFKRLLVEELGSIRTDPSDLLGGLGLDADSLAITPETTGAALIAIDVAMPTDGDRAARPDGDGAARADASGTIDAPDATVGARLRHA
jgi:hypothetical protein